LGAAEQFQELEAEFEEEGAGGGGVEEAGEDQDEGFEDFPGGFTIIGFVGLHDDYLWFGCPCNVAKALLTLGLWNG
jgi:hypothetical protein